MSFSQDVKQLTAGLEALLVQAKELEQRAEELEKQNFLLQEQLVKISDDGDGLKELKNLYDEGFHICRDYFAQPRQEECLFCLSFLHRGGAPQSTERS